MFFSRLSKLALILSLLTSISCGQSTANNTSTSNAQGVTGTTQTPTNPALNDPKNMTQEEIVRKKQEMNKNNAVVGPPSTLQPNQRTFNPAPSPESLPKPDRHNKTADTGNIARSVIRYYNFLTDIRGLNLNLPKEMDGGASAFKAVDVLQFTLKNQPEDKPIAILVAEFNNPQDQAKGTAFMLKLGNSQRKSFQVKNYSLLILGGDERVHKILTDSLEQFR